MLHKFPPLPIIDVLSRGWGEHLPTGQAGLPVRGRERELHHIARALTRREHNNVFMSGKRGVGKTTLIQGFAQAALHGKFAGLRPLPCLLLDTPALVSRLLQLTDPQPFLIYIRQAFASLPASIVILDDAETLLAHIHEPAFFGELLYPFLTSQRHLWLIAEEESWQALAQTYQRYLKSFDSLHIPELPADTCETIIADRIPLMSQRHRVHITPTLAGDVVEAAQRLSTSRAMPDRAVRFLDEICAASVLKQEQEVRRDHIHFVMTQRLGLPTPSAQSRTAVQTLAATLQEKVHGQTAATALVANVLQRSLLGLKNPNRPHGSFLFLGPSGVGKTELARVLSQELYGGEQALVRIDMSEYSEAHNVQRLLGAPPGYVGYEAGGQLTNPIRERPYSLILLDEMEKADPTVFDVFLQVLEDGRLTDGQGQTVDFTQTTLLATSNIGINEIVHDWQRGIDVTSEAWWQRRLLPLLTQHFRLEFLNRFEGIVVFEPLSKAALLAIAHLELEKLENRLAKHHLKITVSDSLLMNHIERLSDPRFGVRPLKRFLEHTAESLIAQKLLEQPV